MAGAMPRALSPGSHWHARGGSVPSISHHFPAFLPPILHSYPLYVLQFLRFQPCRSLLGILLSPRLARTQSPTISPRLVPHGCSFFLRGGFYKRASAPESVGRLFTSGRISLLPRPAGSAIESCVAYPCASKQCARLSPPRA